MTAVSYVEEEGRLFTLGAASLLNPPTRPIFARDDENINIMPSEKLFREVVLSTEPKTGMVDGVGSGS